MAAKDEARAEGKQVLLNDVHYADAVDYDAAIAIAYALNSVYLAKLGEVCPTCRCNNNGHLVDCPERRQ